MSNLKTSSRFFHLNLQTPRTPCSRRKYTGQIQHPENDTQPDTKVPLHSSIPGFGEAFVEVIEVATEYSVEAVLESSREVYIGGNHPVFSRGQLIQALCFSSKSFQISDTK